jgi:serine/threonine protein kinase
MTVCKNFKLTKKLGTGAFGEIYLAVNKNNEEEMYAAKLEDSSAKNPQLFFEAKLYKYLNTEGTQKGIPKVISFCNCRYMPPPPKDYITSCSWIYSARVSKTSLSRLIKNSHSKPSYSSLIRCSTELSFCIISSFYIAISNLITFSWAKTKMLAWST